MSFVPDRSLVTLAPLGPEHVDDVLSWVNDRDVVGNLATFAGTPFSRDDELAYIARMRASKEDRVFSIFASASTSSQAGRYLGQCGLHQIFRRSGVGRVSIVVAERAERGRGIGSAALARLIDVAFAPVADGGEGLHKVWLMCFSTNERARRTYARLGFVEEGVLREEYFHDGCWHDMVRMSVLAAEWEQRMEATAS
jgi:RimJ/RimL family protein N-acetyltransferase